MANKSTDLSGRIYDWDELPQVAPQQRVIQHPVLVLQALQKRVLPDWSLPRPELVVRACALLVDGVDAGGQTAGKAKGFALGDSEGGALVEARAGKEGSTTEGDTERRSGI